MMKLVIFACIILAANCETQKSVFKLPPELKTILLNAFKKCGATEDQVAEYLRFYLHGGIRHDPDFKTMTHCIWKATGYVKEDGRLFIDKAASAFPDKDKMKAVFTECDKTMGSDPVENVHKNFKCFQEYSPFRVSI